MQPGFSRAREAVSKPMLVPQGLCGHDEAMPFHTPALPTQREGIIELRHDHIITRDEIVFRTRGDAVARLTPAAFVRRFLMHTLPPHFPKIRHYGLLSPSEFLSASRSPRRYCQTRRCGKRLSRRPMLRRSRLHVEDVRPARPDASTAKASTRPIRSWSASRCTCLWRTRKDGTRHDARSGALDSRLLVHASSSPRPTAAQTSASVPSSATRAPRLAKIAHASEKKILGGHAAVARLRPRFEAPSPFFPIVAVPYAAREAVLFN